MSVRRAAMIFIVAVLGAFTASTAGNAQSLSARDVIEQFNDTLLKIMREADSLGFSGRYEVLAPAVRSSFDLDFMAQYSAGRHWKELSETQQKELADAFARLTIATYADRFNGYSGERFETVGVDPQRQDMRLVRTHLIKSDGEAIALNYLMRLTEQGWRIVDIFLKGNVSELATRRAEYSSVLRREGYDKLIAMLNQKIALLGKQQAAR